MAEQTERVYEVFIDVATGLFDRRTMWSRLAEEISRARRYHYPLSLMLITFDTPEAQQAVARTLMMAELLKCHTRSVDILVRYSEDTLAILMPCTDERGALKVAERIRQLALTMPLLADGAAPPPVRIGVTSTPSQTSVDKVLLVEQVEWALHKARSNADGTCTVVVPVPQQPATSQGTAA